MTTAKEFVRAHGDPQGWAPLDIEEYLDLTDEGEQDEAPEVER
jgi:hypothetical protein